LLILGSLSGIQRYVFDVPAAGGGQARRLRGRSFFVQVVAEAAMLRLLRILTWPLDDSHVLLSVAGKFALQGPGGPEVPERLRQEEQRINNWLLRETGGELRLSIGWADHAEPGEASHRAAQVALRNSRARPWAPSTSGGWDSVRLVLPPLGTPCDLCGHAHAVEDEKDSETDEVRRLCRWCAETERLGQRLPRARWLVVTNQPTGAQIELFGLGVIVSEDEHISIGSDVLAVANLRDPESRPPWCPPERFLTRRLMACVPVESGRLVEFLDLARRSDGDHLLAVLKVDADSLGLHIEQTISKSHDLRPLAEFSKALDGFFAGRLKAEIESELRWRWIYTVFAGGDDFLMVGPWNVMFDFVGRVHEMFQKQFGGQGMTFSAGLALVQPKRPIKAAVAEAERLLGRAKTSPAPGESDEKDQCAALGQMWKWKQHDEILRTARQLVEWVRTGQVQRGWLHTLLGLAEARHGGMFLHAASTRPPDPLATARLAHHVARNYRPGTPARLWAERLVERFDDPRHIVVRYLPAIVRFALMGTRTAGDKE